VQQIEIEVGTWQLQDDHLQEVDQYHKPRTTEREDRPMNALSREEASPIHQIAACAYTRSRTRRQCSPEKQKMTPGLVPPLLSNYNGNDPSFPPPCAHRPSFPSSTSLVILPFSTSPFLEAQLEGEHTSAAGPCVANATRCSAVKVLSRAYSCLLIVLFSS
jgi:hypothetical protein